MLYKQNSTSHSLYRPIDEGLMEMTEMFTEMKTDFNEVAEIKNYKITFMGDGKLVYVESILDRQPILRLINKNEFWPIQILLGKREGSDKLEVIE